MEGRSQSTGSLEGLGIGTLWGSCSFAGLKIQGRGAITEEPLENPWVGDLT